MRLSLSFILLFLTLNLIAQENRELRAYGPYIAIRIYNMASELNLDRNKQVRLARYLHQLQERANTALLNGEPLPVLKTYLEEEPDTLRSILSPLELNDYYALINEKWMDSSPRVSRLRQVVRLRKELGLEQIQTDTLLSLCTVAESYLSSQSTQEADSVARQGVLRILKEKQRSIYFEKVNEASAGKAAANWIVQLTINDVIRQKDASSVYPLIFQYELKKAAISDQLKFNGQQKEYELGRDQLEADKPDVLIRLETFQNTAINPRIAHVIFNRDELKLKKKEVDSLLSSFRRYKQLIVDTRHRGSKQDLKKYEWTEIRKILSADQCSLYVNIRNRQTGVDLANQDIIKLKRYKLLEGRDEHKIRQELAVYRMKEHSSNTWLDIDNSRKNVFARQDVYENRPEILKLLEQAVSEERNSKVVKF